MTNHESAAAVTNAGMDLIEALAVQARTAGGIDGMLSMWDYPIAQARAAQMEPLARVLERFEDLARAVQRDQREAA